MTAALITPPDSDHRSNTRHRARNELFEALLLESAGPSLWRVCDARVACGQGRFLAFVERKDECFEVMQLADDFIWTVFPTMRAALDHIADTNHALEPLRAAGELAWLK